jgi:hypothetical protein
MGRNARFIAMYGVRRITVDVFLLKVEHYAVFVAAS